MIYSSPGHRCCCFVWASATIAAAWLRHRTDYCAFLLQRREPHGVPSPRCHSFMACATICLTVIPSFSDITDVSTMGQSVKTDRSSTPYFTSRRTETTLEQARNQDFGWEGARIWVPAAKGVRGCHPGKFLKNVHAIGCTKIINLANFKVMFFSAFIRKIFANVKTYWKLKLLLL